MKGKDRITKTAKNVSNCRLLNCAVYILPLKCANTEDYILRFECGGFLGKMDVLLEATGYQSMKLVRVSVTIGRQSVELALPFSG